MVIERKFRGLGKLILALSVIVVLILLLSVNRFSDKAGVAEQDVNGGDINTAEQRSLSAEIPLLIETRDGLPMSISLLASSVQDKNAIVSQNGRTRMVTIGDEITEAGVAMEVLQIADQQLTLRSASNNDLFLVSASVAGAPSLVSKISSNTSVNQPLPIGSIGNQASKDR